MTKLEFKFTSPLTRVLGSQLLLILLCSLPQIKYCEPVITFRVVFISGDGSVLIYGDYLGLGYGQIPTQN